MRKRIIAIACLLAAIGAYVGTVYERNEYVRAKAGPTVGVPSSLPVDVGADYGGGELFTAIRDAEALGGVATLKVDGVDDLGSLGGPETLVVLKLHQGAASVLLFDRSDHESLFERLDGVRSARTAWSTHGGQSSVALHVAHSSFASSAVLYVCQPWFGVPIIYYQFGLAGAGSPAVFFQHHGDLLLHADESGPAMVGWSIYDGVGQDLGEALFTLGEQPHHVIAECWFR